MNKASLASFGLLCAGICCAQATPREPVPFDLSKIGMVVDGHQACEDKGRLQDVPSQVMDKIIAAGTKSVPILIGMITDARIAETEEPIICYFRDSTIGGLAFCLLSDLFTDASYTKTTMPGADWASMMDPEDKDLSSSDQLYMFVKRHGRAALQAKWHKLWARYQGQVYWDKDERCFRLKGK